MSGIPLLMMAATAGASPYETVSLRCAVAVTKVFAHISIHSEDAKGQAVQGVPITERISGAGCVQSRLDPGRTFVYLIDNKGRASFRYRTYAVESSGEVSVRPDIPCTETPDPNACN